MANITRADKVAALYKTTRWVTRDKCRNKVTKETVDRGYRIRWGDNSDANYTIMCNVSLDGDILFYRDSLARVYTGNSAQQYATTIDARITALEADPEAGSSPGLSSASECAYP